MPRSKHRQKGKIRALRNLKNVPPLPSLALIDYEWERHKSTIEELLLREKFGSKPADGWTNDQIDAVIEQWNQAQRQDRLLTAVLQAKYGGNWDDWTWEEIDEARRHLWRESMRNPNPGAFKDVEVPLASSS